MVAAMPDSVTPILAPDSTEASTEAVSNTAPGPELDLLFPRTSNPTKTWMSELNPGDWFLEPFGEEFGEEAMVGYVTSSGDGGSSPPMFVWACTLGKFRREDTLKVDIGVKNRYSLVDLASDIGMSADNLMVTVYKEVESEQCGMRVLLG